MHDLPRALAQLKTASGAIMWIIRARIKPQLLQRYPKRPTFVVAT
jgi:hypothetical protein